MDLLTFVYNLKIEEYKINLNISLDPHLLLNDLNVSVPVFKINNQKSSIKDFLNEIVSFYLAHFIVQLPKTSITLNQLKNPLNLVKLKKKFDLTFFLKITLLWNFKDKFMKSYSNIQQNHLSSDSIQSISNIRFQSSAYKLW